MLKAKLIILFFIIFVFAPSGILFADFNSEVEISKLTAEVDFPEKITFLFEGKSKKKIQDIKVNFKTGERKTLQYGYMDFSKNIDTGIINSKMDVRINTQNGFIPPGSEITWNLIFYFEDGSQFVTDESDFIMLDTRFDDWEFVESVNI